MKYLITILLTSIMIISCNSQIDLEKLKYDTDISNIIKNFNEIEKSQDPMYGLPSYRTKNLNQFKLGVVSFSEYFLPNGNAADYNVSYIHVNNFINNKFLGITFSLVNEKEGNNLLNYLIEKYGSPEIHEASNEGKAYVWYNNNQWILFSQDKLGISIKGKRFLSTNCTIIKQGIRIENSTDESVFTVLENFNLAHPKTN